MGRRLVHRTQGGKWLKKPTSRRSLDAIGGMLGISPGALAAATEAAEEDKKSKAKKPSRRRSLGGRKSFNKDRASGDSLKREGPAPPRAEGLDALATDVVRAMGAVKALAPEAPATENSPKSGMRRRKSLGSRRKSMGSRTGADKGDVLPNAKQTRRKSFGDDSLSNAPVVATDASSAVPAPEDALAVAAERKRRREANVSHEREEALLEAIKRKYESDDDGDDNDDTGPRDRAKVVLDVVSSERRFEATLELMEACYATPLRRHFEEVGAAPTGAARSWPSSKPGWQTPPRAAVTVRRHCSHSPCVVFSP